MPSLSSAVLKDAVQRGYVYYFPENPQEKVNAARKLDATFELNRYNIICHYLF